MPPFGAISLLWLGFTGGFAPNSCPFRTVQLTIGHRRGPIWLYERSPNGASCRTSTNNYAIWVENPVAIKKSGGFQRGKSDQIDAERIAQYAYRFKEKAQLWVPERSVIRKLKALVGMRESLIKSKDSLSKPLKEYQKFMPATYKMLPKSCKESLESLEKNIKGVEKQLQELIDSAEKVKQQYTIATSVKGIGPVTACQLILCRGEFTKMPTGKQFACYAGVVPFDYSSGTSVRGRAKVSPWAPKKMIRPLRSTPITAASTLLQVGPPLGTASVFGLVGPPLGPFPWTLMKGSTGVPFP